MKTLGEIPGILPEKMFNKGILSDKQKGFDKALDHLSTLKALDVVKAIIKSGAVRIEICDCSRFGVSLIKQVCPTCDGQGWVISDPDPTLERGG